MASVGECTGLRPEPFLRVCHGRRALETIRMAAPDLDAEAEVKAFVPVEEAETAPMGPLPGAVRLLDTLPKRSWAVATSGVRRIATAASAGPASPCPRCWSAPRT